MDIFVHKVIEDKIIEFDDGGYRVEAYSTIDDEPEEAMELREFYFPLEVDLRDFIKVVNNSFEPICLRVEAEENDENSPSNS